ncbi:ABC transporter ATP-binding protein [Pseudoalteromonas sp. NEC-BIFX-2020_002]|uniref:ABC transporter ATP-binding protein n=1 Tax=Pseudoalteromonas sp. NEC-BIFX-2020_002 TaxID=2732353 RepID=UPI0014769E45|nr:ABC transporter ATP-binding protein [Pseudoalteromonas sp. NEC-BIFX-2020_002]NNG41411.1 ABC transporter ATP-binding protein [Pseudoalteromonas sp. NEC-BIFX-2020_002]
MAHVKPVMLTLENVSFGYKQNAPLSIDNVSLSLIKGSCTAILGPNGAGKSTLISLMTGLLMAQTGAINYPFYKQYGLTQAIAQKVALVPQDFAFYHELSVYDNLAFFVSISEKNRHLHAEQIAAAIKLCNLEEVVNKTAGTLSGGYKRRLNIAIALSKQPDIIFLDEPTVGIDPLSRDAIITLLLDLKRQGKTLVYTSHLLHEVAQLCDDVVFLRGGKVVACEALNSEKLSLSFSTFKPLLNTQSTLFSQQLVTLEGNYYQLVINNSEQLGAAFSALGQLSDDIKALSFSDNHIEQLYRDLFAEPLC